MPLQHFDSSVAIGERSSSTPSLALLSDNANLVLAWTEFAAPNRISLAVCPDVNQRPLVFSPKVTLPYTTAAGPAIAIGPNGLIYLSWRGAGGDGQLYFSSAIYASQGGFSDFAVPLGLNEWSWHAPALSGSPYDGDPRVFIAWTGTDEFALVNVKLSTTNGRVFDDASKATLREDSISNPGLAFIPTSGLIKDLAYVFWTGTDANSSVNVIDSAVIPGPTHMGQFENWHNKKILPEVSPAGPAAGSTFLNDEVLLAWLGYDVPRHINSLRVPVGINNFAGTKVIFDVTSIAAPSICGIATTAYAMAWIDEECFIHVGVNSY